MAHKKKGNDYKATRIEGFAAMGKKPGKKKAHKKRVGGK